MSAGEQVILKRVIAIDKGEGCWAAVSTIGKALDPRHPGEPRHQSYGVAQTRRHLRRLRELGAIHFLGQTPQGNNIYIHARGHYPRLEIIPLCPSRTLDHLRALPGGDSWATDKAREILRNRQGLPVPAPKTYIDGYPVNAQMRASYSDETLRRSIAAIKRQYEGSTVPIRNHSALLKHFIQLDKDAEARRTSAAFTKLVGNLAGSEGTPAEPAADDLAKEILDQLKAGRHEQAQQLDSLRQTGNAAAAVAPAASRPAGPTVKEVLARLAAAKERPGSTKGGMTFVQGKLTQLERLLGPVRVIALTGEMLSSYKRQRRAEHVRETTIHAELKVLRQALRLAAAEGLVEVALVSRLLPARHERPMARARGDP